MIVALAVSFIVSALARPLAACVAPHGGWIMALLPAGLFVFFLSKGMGLEGTGAISETIDWVPALGISLTLTLDGFSWLFALLITGIGTLVTIYAGAYFAEKPAHKGASFLAMILVFMSAMLGTVLSDNLIALYLFWEMTSLVSFLLIGFDTHRPEARKAALQSLVVTAGGGLALFAGILLIGMVLGTYSLSEVAARSDELVASPYAGAIMVLVLLGAFTKSAQVPFQFWLPAAMEAPTPASAYLHSATMVKLGIYLLARFDPIFAAMPAFGTILVVFGTATMLAACLSALTREGYKAILAQSTVASLGVLVMLIGLDGEVAATATIGFILAHALYKAALFFCAGTAIHATGRTSLIEINGLAGALPWTAAGAALAAISMAGLPPTLGFISKEYLFEGQIGSSFGWIWIAFAVLGNAVFVAIALIASLRPFFLGRRRAVDIAHGETPGLVLGPIVLASLGLLFGLAPSLIALPLIEPAASAIAGRPLGISFSLWHGLTPMLALSAVVVALGIVLYLLWAKILDAVRGSETLDRLVGDDGYEALMAGIMRLARGATGLLQNGDPRRYGAVVVAAVLAIVAYGLTQSGASLAMDPGRGEWHLASAAILGFMVFGGFSAIYARSLLSSIVAVGIIGFGSALIFLFNGAPDLALTQFSVEVLVVVILTALLLQLPVRAPLSRAKGERRFDVALSAGFALVIFLALATMVTQPLDLRLTEYFSQTSYAIAHGRNVVNVILVDYRGLDTLGEIAVISFAAMAVWGLLRRRANPKASGGAPK